MYNKKINACLTDSMRDLLLSLKGKTLKYIECVPLNGCLLENNRVFESVRINIGKSSIDITNKIHPIPQTEEEEKSNDLVMEYGWFECFFREKNEGYLSPILTQQPVKYLINEKINDVIIVSDEITSKDGYWENADRAILIRTAEKLYSFIRNVYWEDSIYIRIGDSIEGLPSEKEISEQFGDVKLSVKRSFIFL